MNKILITTIIAILSSAAIAESTTVDQNKLANTQAEKTVTHEIILAKNEATNLALWEDLDINKDGSISKIEAAASKEIFDMWYELDTNKDERLDTEEFAQLMLENK